LNKLKNNERVAVSATKFLANELIANQLAFALVSSPHVVRIRKPSKTSSGPAAHRTVKDI